MSKILVTAIGSFSSDAVINNLKQSGHYIIGTDIYKREWIAQSTIVDAFYQVPRAFEELYIDTIIALCIENEVDYIVPLTDDEVDTINANRDSFAGIGVVVCIPSSFSLEICRNKHRLYTYLVENGLTSNVIQTNTIYDLNTNKLTYPLIAKPINGRSSIGLLKIHDKNELDYHMKYIDAANYVFQPFISGRIITVDVIRDKKSKTIISVSRLELLRTGNGAGISVRVFIDSDLENLCKRLAEILDINGCVNFEFILNKDTYYLLECNPRFSGGVAFSCLAGYDFINNHLKCFTQDTIDSLEAINELYIARKYEEYIMS